MICTFQTWLISKMRHHKSIVEPILVEICELVRLEEFSNVVEELVCVKCKQTPDEKDTVLNSKSSSTGQNISTCKVR